MTYRLMSRSVDVLLECDECGDDTVYYNCPVDGPLAEAKGDGWWFGRDDVCQCPSCAASIAEGVRLSRDADWREEG